MEHQTYGNALTEMRTNLKSVAKEAHQIRKGTWLADSATAVGFVLTMWGLSTILSSSMRLGLQPEIIIPIGILGAVLFVKSFSLGDRSRKTFDEFKGKLFELADVRHNFSKGEPKAISQAGQ